MSGSDDTSTGKVIDLRKELEKRKTWFFECQLRGLNFETFRGISEVPPRNARLDIISEPLYPTNQSGVQMKDLGLVYLDDQEPVWTPDEKARRDAFADKFIGINDNWLGYKSGAKLAGRLAELKKKYEKSAFSSEIDLDPELMKYGRNAPGEDMANEEPKRSGSMGGAISRAALAQAKPWLIPELYNAKKNDAGQDSTWIDNLVAFVANFEAELGIAAGSGQPVPADPFDREKYRDWIKSTLEASSTRNVSDSLKARMLTQVDIPVDPSIPLRKLLFLPITYKYEINIETPGYPMGPVDKFPAESVRYWTGTLKNALGEVYVNKPNADMGLCLIIRTIYLLGVLPSTLGSDEDLTWRKRSAPDDKFARFFAQKAEDLMLDGKQLTDFQVAQAKLQVILEESAKHPRSAAPTFSPLTQEIVRQALHAFKFWMDEPLRVSSNQNLINARKTTKIVTSEHETDAEMEYWSENHYIMFASSEFLAGQLWEFDEFQPGKEFLDPDSKSGILTGMERKERGKARVLKWLNNRLQFGWMEFNSSGYYREHLWALLNLADFSLDREVRDKAALAIDLLLFDVTRFLHKGTMGAAGGRSQFKSKDSGWDNALADAVEILFGARGIFQDKDGQIGASISTSTYKTPEVLLEIGTHPPETPFTDRSRVSITFEEAPKYGISYSKESDQKDSVMEGYAPKRARYYPFIDTVNKDIARTHPGYGATDDDTVFWWGTSAFYNKQIVRGTFDAVKKFGLEKSPVFGALKSLVRVVSGYEKIKHGLIGGLIGSVSGAFGAVLGTVAGFFEDDVFGASLLEAASNDLSVLLEGSTRTRANILSFRNQDIMLSSIQNFRPGQFNFQSSICQASLNPAVNVFTTAGFENIDISDLDAVIGGGLFGAALTAATGGVGGVLVVVSAVGGIIANEATLTNADLGLVDHEDGPGWWTGSWALPMVVQHDSAAILAYDFHTIQNLLAKSGSHAWFPKTGFDRVDEMRTSAYDDANFPLLDIGDIGPKGFWLFGKITHPPSDKSNPPDEPREAYIGVFSNQRPQWLDQGSDFYKEQIQEIVRKPIKDTHKAIADLLDKIKISPLGGADARDAVEAAVGRAVDDAFRTNISRDDWLQGAIHALAKISSLDVPNFPVLLSRDYMALAGLQIDLRILQRVWPDPLPQDYFADRDWYVKGKNVWIVQVGSREEFGDFQSFKDRVSSARIHMDDSGDMECSYDIPRPGGSSERLTLAYGDGGRFGLNGSPLLTDMFPRFENDKFLRGGRVEWGQREYVIEYNGKTLLHDFSDFSQPVRQEGMAVPTSDEKNTIKGLVIFLKTEDEDMDAFTVATANVSIGCGRVTTDQVVAAGPVGENTCHDSEWVFFDFSAMRDADMTIDLTHPASSKGDDTPHWKMSFELRALMGDRTIRSCSLSYAHFNFEDQNRTSWRFPFSVSLAEWRPWQPIRNNKKLGFWMIARHLDFARDYFDYNDLLALDENSNLWHRRLTSCDSAEAGWFPVPARSDAKPDFTAFFSVSALATLPRSLFILIQSQGTLFVNWALASGDWSAGWSKLPVTIYPDAFLGIPDTTAAPIPVALATLSAVASVPSALSPDGAELYVLAGDGHFYSHPDWHPYDTSLWRKIDVIGFSVLYGTDFVVAGDYLFVLGDDRAIWATIVDHSRLHLSPSWERITSQGVAIGQFTATCENGICQIVVAGIKAGMWAASYTWGNVPDWVEHDLPNTSIAPGASLTSAVPCPGCAHFFALATDGNVYAIEWESASGWSASKPWAAIQPDAQGFEPRAAGGIAAITRVNGQIELFAQGADNQIFKAWWS
jgi:hypothetical protein